MKMIEEAEENKRDGTLNNFFSNVGVAFKISSQFMSLDVKNNFISGLQGVKILLCDDATEPPLSPAL